MSQTFGRVHNLEGRIASLIETSSSPPPALSTISSSSSSSSSTTTDSIPLVVELETKDKSTSESVACRIEEDQSGETNLTTLKMSKEDMWKALSVIRPSAMRQVSKALLRRRRKKKTRRFFLSFAVIYSLFFN